MRSTNTTSDLEGSNRGYSARIDALLKPYHDRKWKSTVDKFPLDIQACFHKPLHERTSWEHQMAYLVERQFQEEGGGPLAGMSKEDKKEYERLEERTGGVRSAQTRSAASADDGDRFLWSAVADADSGDPRQTPIAPGFPGRIARRLLRVRLVSEVNRRKRTARRTELAQWIADPENPLTTRVIVNRIWQQHFGRGIVATANDFGHLGQPPTHPELLDWLTRSFVENGWSMKRLHKLILMSATWQQSALSPAGRGLSDAGPGR